MGNWVNGRKDLYFLQLHLNLQFSQIKRFFVVVVVFKEEYVLVVEMYIIHYLNLTSGKDL